MKGERPDWSSRLTRWGMTLRQFTLEHWRILAAINSVIFVALIGGLIWLAATPGRSTTTTNPGARSSAKPGARATAVTPTRVPVFAVASPYSSTPSLSPTQALFTGHVVDSVTKRPLAGAEINIEEAGPPIKLHTDATGLFKVAVETAQPFGFTVDAAGHGGGVGFGKVCAGDHKDVTVPLPAAGGAPAPPIALQGSSC